MSQNADPIRALDPSPSAGDVRVHAKGGFGDVKKIVVLLVLLAVGGSVMAYQFLWAKGAKTAAADTAAPGVNSLLPAANQGSVETVLAQLEAKSKGEEELTVASVEELVRKFDTYVQDRQVPLSGLRVNPFEVVRPKEVKTAEQALGATAAADQPEAVARKKKLQDVAGRLVLGSVMLVGDRGMAMISGKLCQIGDTVQGLRVEAIEPERVILAAEGDTVELRLRGKSGVSGGV